MDGLFLREVFNAMWSVLNFGLFTILLIYLHPQLKPGWYNDFINKLVAGALFYFLGGAGYRATVGVILHLERHGYTIAYTYLAWVLGFFAFLAFAGGLCLIRLFSRPPGPLREGGPPNSLAGNGPWTITVCLMVVVAVITIVFRNA